MMALNIEGLPIEGIDRIQITLNPRLKWYIDYTKRQTTTYELTIHFIFTQEAMSRYKHKD
jgi:hypothetical protein